MVPGLIPNLAIGALEHLASGKDEEFPVAINQWRMAAQLLAEARGAVISKSERVRPLWLTLRNEKTEPVPLAWVTYRIHLKNGLDVDSFVIKADLSFQNIPANGEARVGLLDLDAWNFVKAEVMAVSLERQAQNPPEGAEPETSLTHQVSPQDLWVVVYCPTGVSFSRPAQVTFNLPDENARIRFRHPSPRETLCITKHHNLPGLIAVVEMPQRSGDLLGHAFQAQAICDGVVSSAFALTLADMRESFPVLACDATSGVTDRTFVHFFADRLVMGRRAHLDPEQWSARASGVFNQSSKRVLRAIRWLRKMHTEDDILDRFLAGWTGLETLNPELCKHFGISPTAPDVRECGKCGEKLVREVNRATGLKELFVREGKADVYAACSPARNGLVHGFQDLGELTVLARTHTSDVGLMLARGIQLLSGITIPTDPEMFKWLNGFRVASFLFFEGTLNCGELAAYENNHNELPLLEFTLRHEGGVIDEKNFLNSEANISMPPDCSISMKGMGVSGPVTITKLQAEVTPKRAPTTDKE